MTSNPTMKLAMVSTSFPFLPQSVCSVGSCSIVVHESHSCKGQRDDTSHYLGNDLLSSFHCMDGVDMHGDESNAQ